MAIKFRMKGEGMDIGKTVTRAGMHRANPVARAELNCDPSNFPMTSAVNFPPSSYNSRPTVV